MSELPRESKLRATARVVTTEHARVIDRIGRVQWANEERQAWAGRVRALVATWDALAAHPAGPEDRDSLDALQLAARRIEAAVLAGPRPYPDAAARATTRAAPVEAAA